MGDREASPTPPGLVIRRLGPGDDEAVAGAAHLFDHQPDPAWTNRFLGEPTHHLLVAFLDGRAAGFVSGVETTHPDKGTEMFLYELSVDPAHRRQGIAKALLAGLVSVARERGCYGMWVLTDEENEPAMAAYRSAGGTPTAHVMFAWAFEDSKGISGPAKDAGPAGPASSPR